ncbi:unnamed protein product [Blepharisma stoltei]|uniref:FGFR1 oncogene partner (FOP) N-terminal dimerisation domain-containing protein n=1 Tax=Blepharisma stoltei TaxID=1481888 RepID=A0AAU9JPR4_9CILI|nr:unnamed protein product [Blepharisma stoltei]
MLNNGQLIESIISHPNFPKIRARLRANIYHVLAARDPMQTTNVFAKNFSSSEEGQIIIALFKDYLECADLYNTLEVFMPESGNMNILPSRDQLKALLGIELQPGIPILVTVIENIANKKRAKMPSLQIPSFKGKNETITQKFGIGEFDRKAAQKNPKDVLELEESSDSGVEEEQLDFRQLLRIPRRNDKIIDEKEELEEEDEEEDYRPPVRKKSL